MKKTIKNIWKIICYPLMYIWIQIVITFVYTIGVGIIVGITLGIESVTSGEALPLQEKISETVLSSTDLRIAILISGAMTFIVIFLMLGKEWKTDKLWSFVNVKALPMLLCILLGVALNTFTICILSLLPVSWQQQPIDGMIGNNIILEIMSLALLAPILEEIIFRGIVLKRLTKMMKLPVAVILQALIFAVIHFNLLQGAYAFILGIVLGLVYIRLDSIWYAVALHIVYNSISIIISHIVGDTEINLLYFIIISSVILAVTMTGLTIWVKKKRRIDNIPDTTSSMLK